MYESPRGSLTDDTEMISVTNAPNFYTVNSIWASSEVLIARGPSIPEPLLRIYFSDLSLSFTSNFQISFDAPPVKGSRFMISPLMDSLSSFFYKRLPNSLLNYLSNLASISTKSHPTPLF